MGGSQESKLNELSEEDLAFLTRNTKFDSDTIKEWYENFIVECPDGQLDRDRFLSMYEAFFSEGDPDEFCTHVFRTFDTDGNGSVSFKEFLLAVGVTTSGTRREKLSWAFKMYDIDGDGRIQQDEMLQIIKALYSMLGSELDDTPEERTQLIFEKMDFNHDDKLSLVEFLEGCDNDPTLAQLLTHHATSAPSSNS